MKTKVLFAASLLATSAMSFAESYQSELGFKATRDTEDGVSSKENSYAAFGQYFFKPVETNGLPYEEAAYLGKASNVFAHIYDVPAQNGSSDFKSYSVGGEVYVPEHFLYASVEGRRSQCCGYHVYDLTTTVGVTPLDGLRVTTSYNSKQDYRVNLAGKYVTAIGDGQFVNLEASYYDGKSADTLMVGGDFYFDRTFSVGGSITDTDGDHSYEARVRKYFSPTFAGELAYADYEHGSAISAGVSVRF